MIINTTDKYKNSVEMLDVLVCSRGVYSEFLLQLSYIWFVSFTVEVADVGGIYMKIYSLRPKTELNNLFDFISF